MVSGSTMRSVRLSHDSKAICSKRQVHSECLISTASFEVLQSRGFCVHQAAKVRLGTGDMRAQVCREKHPLADIKQRLFVKSELGGWLMTLAIPMRGTKSTGDFAEMQ